jgi:predicted nuclease of restriction endonuclease-like RecB superfamily
VLTADLAGVRRRGDELRLLPVDARTRARIETLAAAYEAIARASIGQPREEVEAAFRGIEVVAAERRLAGAVLKLVRDGCVFEEAASEDPVALRRELFHRASAARHAPSPLPDDAARPLPDDAARPLPDDVTSPIASAFDRAAIVEEVARARGLTPAELERALFADRAGALRLLALHSPPPVQLAAGFELAEAQAVLLRAVKLTAIVQARDAATYRHLFRRLKFLRLLPTIEPLATGGVRLEIDGPLSLFQAVTRYGLQLGLALPAIAACDRWELEADVRWGTERRAARFLLSSASIGPDARASAGTSDGGPAMRDDVKALIAAFEKLGSEWRVDPDPAVLDLPGAGLCVPDLAFERERHGRVVRVHLEGLGFWSREAVFRRIDLVRAGLPHKILFAVSRELRVSEELLRDVPSAALYVFTRVLGARAILERLDALADDDAARP